MSMMLAALMRVSCAHIAESAVLDIDLDLDYVDAPMGPQPIPGRCVSAWRASGTGVTLDRRRLQLHIGRDAVPGLSVRVGGHREVLPLVVRGDNEPVLEGRWVRNGAPCSALPYVELVFDDAGKLTYTSPERMVETMTDGTRPYAWDAASGRITSTLFDGGAASVVITGDVLILHLADACEATLFRN